MKEKLIHTELLKKYNHTSPVGFATAPHLDYCRWCYKKQKYDFYKDFSAYLEYFSNLFRNFVYIILIPLTVLTRGYIFFPLWIYHHRKVQKELIKKHGIEKINQSAKDILDKEMNNK